VLPQPAYDEVRSAEVIGALCLATDLGMGLPLEHGLRSTMIAMRLAERLGLDDDESRQTFYGCLLFYVGCTADAETEAALFPPGALLRHFAPVMFGSSRETTRGILRALADPDSPAPLRLLQGVIRMPRAGRSFGGHLDAMCEVAEMLCDDLGMPTAVRDLFGDLTARWDGHGPGSKIRGEEIPIALRVIHVARDTAFHQFVGGVDAAARVIRERSGHAFDPAVVRALIDDPAGVLPADDTGSVWEATMALEPAPWLTIGSDGLDRALAAMGRFADLLASCFHGHAAAVSELAGTAASALGLPPDEVTGIRRCGLVHDLGRVAVSSAVWTKPTTLTPDEWEQVRLHPYYTERVLGRTVALAALVPVAASHHERLDGSGYHRGATAASLPMSARVLAAADAYRTLTEPRPHRPPSTPAEAGAALGEAAGAGLLDVDAVSAVLRAAGQSVPRISRPAGLTDREAQVLAMVARGLLTKQVATRLGISPKTADRHLQNAYAKAGVSTRAAAALFVMKHGLTDWGELPIPPDRLPS
jgi:HD-GYP domain-containing protein (c-di-GMP phosphodiesterase class II)